MVFGGRGFECTTLFFVGCGFESISFLGGCGFESTSLFWGVLGLSPHLCFLGVGEFVLYFVLFGWWWSYFDFLGDYFKGNFFFFVFVLWWNFIYNCLTSTHSFTRFFFYCGDVQVLDGVLFIFLGTNM